MKCPNCGIEVGQGFCRQCGFSPDSIDYRNINSEKKLTGPLPLNYMINNRYVIIDIIGSGGMGRAYKAMDETLKRICVIKEFDSELGNLKGNVLKEAINGFEREARILTELRHENMPAVFDFFKLYGREYFVTEYIDGKNLNEITGNGKKYLKESQLIEIGISICDVLMYVHSRKPSIVHRDIKPDNIIASGNNKYYLIDFGAARNYVEGRNDTIAFGTAGYAAPEAANKMTETKSDIYSLGMTLFVLATGKSPDDFVIDSFPMASSINKNISQDLSKIISKAISLNIDKRFSAEEMKIELLRIKGGKCNCIYCGRTVEGSISRCPYCGELINEIPSFKWENVRGDRTGKAYRPYKVNFKGNIKWRIDNLGSNKFSPIVSEDKIILPIEKGTKIEAFDIVSGREVWQVSSLRGNVAKNGFIMGGYSFFPLFDSIIKVDVDTGITVSTFNIPEGTITAPLNGFGGYIIAVCGNNVLKIDADNGNCYWTYRNERAISTYVSCIDDEIVFGDEAGIVTCLTVSGEKIWYVSTRGGKVAQAIAYDNGLYFLCTIDGKIVCIEKNGIIGWSRSEAKQFSYSPCVCGDILVIGSIDNGVTSYSKVNGRELWNQTSIKRAVSAPVCCGDKIFIFDYNSSDAICLNFKGEIIKRFSAVEQIMFPSAIYKDNIIAVSIDGNMIVLN